MPRASKQPPAAVLTAGSAGGGPLAGAVAAALVTAGFVWTSGASPAASLLLALALALVLALALTAARRQWPAGGSLFEGVFSAPVTAGLALAVYAGLRWRFMPITHAGRGWVIDLQWFGLALAAGGALPAALRAQGEAAAASLGRWLRRLAACALALFCAHAFYQYFIDYPARYRELLAGQRGPVTDLMTQSLLHALAERRVSGQLGNPNLFAAQLSFMTLLALGCVSRREPWPWRLLGALAALAALATVALTASRGGALTWAFVAALGVLIHLAAGNWRGARRPPDGTVAIIALLAALACAPQAGAASWAERLTRNDTIRERLFYWGIALKVWAGHPLFGAGPGGFVLAYPLLKPELARESQYAHSWFFQIGADLGAAGLALAFCFWGCLLARFAGLARRARQGLLSPASAEALWPLGAALTLGLNGLVEFSLQWREFLIAAGLLGGLGCGLAQWSPAGAPVRAGGWPRLRGFAGGALALASLGCALTLTPPFQRAQVLTWAGRAELDDKNPPAAERVFESAAQAAPDDPQRWLDLAQARAACGDANGSGEAINKAIALDPRSPGARAALGEWWLRRGDMARALEAIGRAIELYPSSTGHRLTRAEWSLAAGRAGDARRDLLYIESHKLPVWEFEQPRLDALMARAGLQPAPAAR